MADQNPPGNLPVPPSGGGSPRVDIGAAISWAFDRFKANAAAFVGLAAVVTVIYVLQNVGTSSLQNIVVDCSNPESPGQVNACTAALGVSALAAIFISLVFALAAFIAQIERCPGVMLRMLRQPPARGDRASCQQQHQHQSAQQSQKFAQWKSRDLGMIR